MKIFSMLIDPLSIRKWNEQEDIKLKKGDIIELDIVKLSSEGKGISKINRVKIKPESADTNEENYVVFVQGAYPGDRIKAQLRKIKKA